MQLFELIYLTQFNYFDSDVLTFTFCMEDGERCPQSHSVEYDWIGPEPTRNSRRRYISTLLVSLITQTPASPAQRFYLELSWYHIVHLLCGGYDSIHMFRHSTYNTPPMIRGI